MPISRASSDVHNVPDEDIDVSDIPELTKSFFAGAILNRPGESLVDTVRTARRTIPSVSVTYARSGVSTKANALGMRPMQERAYEKRGEQYLLIKSPPASGKSRALMFVALDKLANQGLKQAIIVVPERSIGASFNDDRGNKLSLLNNSATGHPVFAREPHDNGEITANPSPDPVDDFQEQLEPAFQGSPIGISPLIA